MCFNLMMLTSILPDKMKIRRSHHCQQLGIPDPFPEIRVYVHGAVMTHESLNSRKVELQHSRNRRKGRLTR